MSECVTNNFGFTNALFNTHNRLRKIQQPVFKKLALFIRFAGLCIPAEKPNIDSGTF